MTTDQPAVLIVEDDEATAELERRVLARCGLQTHLVTRVKQALELLEHETFSAILLDYHLPDGDSWEIVEAAEAKQPRIPVILVTAQGNERIASEAIHRGVAEYVKKSEQFWDRLPGILDRVTRLAKAEQGLRRMEEFFERARLGAAVGALDGTFERVNLAFAEMHGYCIDEMIAKPIETVFAPEWRAKLPTTVATIAERGALRFEADHVRKDGAVFSVVVDATVIRDDRGRPSYHAMYVQDVTAQKRVEASLQASERKANAILDAIPDLMFRLTRDGVYLDFKAHRTNDLYVPPDKIIGRGVRELMPPMLADEILVRIQQALVTGAIQQWVYQLPMPQGSQDYEARMVASGSDEVIAIVRNITQERAAERAIEASLREKEVMLREKEVMLQEIHHRVKNNLQVISSLIHMQARLLEDPASRIALKQCQTRVQTISLVHEKLYQFNDYSRVPFSQYARSLIDNVVHVMGEPNSVSIQTALEDVALAMDRAIPCGLILNELITNALKHAFPDGRKGAIRVEVSRVGDHATRLVVADDGRGIPEGIDIQKGSSLGMYLVATLTRQLHGTLDVTRQPGVTVCVTFPTTPVATP